MTRNVSLRALAPKIVEIENIVIDLKMSGSHVTIPHVVFVAKRDGNEVGSILIPAAGPLREFSLLHGVTHVTQWGAELPVSRNEKILVAVEVNDDYEGYFIPSGTSVPAGTTIGLEESGGYRSTLRPGLLARGWAWRWPRGRRA